MIRFRQSDDLELVHELDLAAFDGERTLTTRLLENSLWWVGYRGKEPVAYCGLEPQVTTSGPTKANLCRAGVLHEARCSGLQKHMVKLRVRYARALGLSRVWTYVSLFNVPSQRALIACGFKPYYAFEHFIAFERHLTGPQVATRFPP